MTLKNYPEEFKRQAVELYETTPGATIGSISHDLGVSRSTLSIWKKRYGTTAQYRTVAVGEQSVSDSDDSRVRELQTENRVLRLEKAKLETEREIPRQAAKYSLRRDKLVSRFQFVEDHRDTYEVKWLCAILEIAKSSFYAWRKGFPARAARKHADEELSGRIRHAQSPTKGGDPAYAPPRVTAHLNDGVPACRRVNHKRVARVMRERGLAGLRLRRRVKATIPDQSTQKIPDALQRDFTAQRVNPKYVGDITYLPLASGGNLYLATMIDCYSRKLVGWAVADHMRVSLVIDALKDAAHIRGSLVGTVFHSDRGSVYTSESYATVCQSLGVTQSMGAVGSSADNALAESFNATLKREVLAGNSMFRDEVECRRSVFQWATQYNTVRQHSYCGLISPDRYESTTLRRTA
ncbi:IS3 family transposase [Lysinibacter sp. HNR]|uniref:IS3 family transposase n=1 Tax=Lysinibacter sp. HNR TaxID=3031408 RepID=UPI002435DE33|nr:IS3 family transposase [Lysinibacter sp. HNR]WGD36864.1 IS3 family transposase [Lysinibacter sp. HNR]